MALCVITVLWIPVVKAAEGGQLFSYMVVFEGFIAGPLPVLFLLAVFWKKTTEMVIMNVLQLNCVKMCSFNQRVCSYNANTTYSVRCP